MLKLYYSTTKGHDEVQSKFYGSLGGYKSITPVRNSEFDNFFGEISSYSIANNNESQYIGLVLKNEGADKTGIVAYFDYPEKCYSKIHIAAVDMIEDSNGDLFFESVPSINSSPLYAEFHEADGVDNAVALGDLLSGEMVGIWLKRELLLDTIIQDKSNIVEQDPDNDHRYIEVELGKSDVIKFNLEYM